MTTMIQQMITTFNDHLKGSIMLQTQGLRSETQDWYGSNILECVAWYASHEEWAEFAAACGITMTQNVARTLASERALAVMDYVYDVNRPQIHDDDVLDELLLESLYIEWDEPQNEPWLYGSLVPVTADSEPITMTDDQLQRIKDRQNNDDDDDLWLLEFWLWNNAKFGPCLFYPTLCQ